MLLVIKMKNFKKNSVDNKLCGSAKAVLCPNCCQSGCLKPSPFLSFPGCSSPPQTSVKLFFPIILSFTCRYWIPGLCQFLRTQYTGPATDRIFFSILLNSFQKSYICWNCTFPLNESNTQVQMIPALCFPSP